jgi:hypothetical protein
VSESPKTRIEKLESAIAPGDRCPHCGRLVDDEAEQARLNVKAMEQFPWDEYADLFRRRVAQERVGGAS